MPQGAYSLSDAKPLGAFRLTDARPVVAPPPVETAPTTMTDEQWATLSPGDKLRNMMQWGGKAIAGMTGMGSAGREAVESPKTTLALAALPNVAKVVDALPSATRAGAKFQGVMSAAKDVPIDTAGVGNAALRISQLAERGGTMPKAVRDILKRMTDPDKADMTYGEARDFYSNISRLSANEFQRLTPVVKREVINMRLALNGALTKAAGVAGKGEDYTAAMKEYANAARMREFGEMVKKWALPAGAGGAAALYGRKKLADLASLVSGQ